MSMPKVACVGAGYWGANLVRTFYELGALHRIVEEDEARRLELAGRYPSVLVTADLAAALADPDVKAVAIATPAATHAELARVCLEAGKDVLVEKPLCLSVSEGEQMVRRAEALGRILMVGHLLRYHPAVCELTRLAASGELGRIQYIAAERLNLGRFRREENVLWSLGPHDISVILALLGEMPTGVTSHGSAFLHPTIRDVHASALTFPGGAAAYLFFSWLHPFKQQRLAVVGDRQMAVFSDTEPVNKLLLYPSRAEWRGGQPVPLKGEPVPVPFSSEEPLRAECTHFLECVATRRTPVTDGQEAVRVLSVLEACEAGALPKPEAHAAGRSAAPGGAGADTGVFVHESSYVDEGSSIGAGTAIWHFSHVLKNCQIGPGCRIGQNVVIGPNVRVGAGVKIQNNVSVYEGVELEDEVFCGPSVVFTNVHNPRSHTPRMHELRTTRVRRGATLGANATIVCGVTIGEHAFVGAGAVIARDVPAHALVVGNPSRIVGWVCQCGSRIAFEPGAELGRCSSCYAAYRHGEGRVWRE